MIWLWSLNHCVEGYWWECFKWGLQQLLETPQGPRPSQGTQGPQCASNRETTVSCCRPISTPQILPVLLLPLFPGWDSQIFQGVFLNNVFLSQGSVGRCVSEPTANALFSQLHSCLFSYRLKRVGEITDIFQICRAPTVTFNNGYFNSIQAD